MTAPPLPTIRPATDADGPAVARVIAACFAEYPGCFYAEAEFPELARPATAYASRGGRMWVAEAADGTVVGSLAVFPTRDPATFEIGKVYVARAARRGGVASRMLAQALDLARAAGARRVRLFTDTRFADAHRFYERHGFRRLPGVRHVADVSQSWEFAYDLALSAAR